MKKLKVLFIALLILTIPILANGSGVTGGGFGSGIQIDSNCNQSQYFPIGKLCQDTGTGKLYKGIGLSISEIAAGTGTGDFSGPSASTDGEVVLFSGTGGKIGKRSNSLNGIGFLTAGILSTKVIGIDIQAHSANLDTFAGIAPTANVQSLLGAANYAGMKTLMGYYTSADVGVTLEGYDSTILKSANIGSTVQAYNIKLNAIANLVNGAGVLTNDGLGNFSYGSGSGSCTGNLCTITASANAQILLGENFTSMLSSLGAQPAGSYAPASGIALSALATQSNNTILGNVSGGAASPSALSASQIKTLLGYPTTAADVYGLWTGTKDSSHCLAGDGTMQSCAGGGSMTWPSSPGIVTWATGTAWGSPATSSTIIALFGSGSCSGFLKSDGTCSTPSGGGTVTDSGTPTIHQWSVFTNSTNIKGVSVTASSAVCTDANGEPIACAGEEFGDNAAQFYNYEDNTKQGIFSLSGLTTNTIRTWTMPDANGTVALLSNINLSAIDTLYNTTSGASKCYLNNTGACDTPAGGGSGTILGTLNTTANVIPIQTGVANTLQSSLVTIDPTTGIITTPQGTNPDFIQLREGSGAGSYYAELLGPASLSNNYVIQLPSSEPTANQIPYVVSNTSHLVTLGWTSNGGGSMVWPSTPGIVTWVSGTSWGYITPGTGVAAALANALNSTGGLEGYDSTILKSANIGSTVEGYDSTILKSAAIGVTVEGYDSTILKSANIGSTVQGYNANTIILAETDGDFIYGASGAWTKAAFGTGVETALTQNINGTDGFITVGNAAPASGSANYFNVPATPLAFSLWAYDTTDALWEPIIIGANLIYTQNTHTLSASASSGMTNPMTTLGDLIVENATPAADRLAGNTTTTRKFLRQVGNGTISALPAWDNLFIGDIPSLNSLYLPATQNTAANLPTTCTSPQSFFATDTKTYYFCTATNEWFAAFSKGANGSYYDDMGNNTSYTPVSGHYRYLFLNGVPEVDSNGTATALQFAGASNILANWTGTKTSSYCAAGDGTMQPCGGGGSFVGGTLTSKLITETPVTGNAGFNLPAGTIATTPVSGDLTHVTGHLYFYDQSTQYDLLKPVVSGSQNLVWATPDGQSGVPTLRALVAADIPALNYAPVSGSANYEAANTNLAAIAALANGAGALINNGSGTFTYGTPWTGMGYFTALPAAGTFTTSVTSPIFYHGSSAQLLGTAVFYNANNAYTITLESPATPVASHTITLPNTGNVTLASLTGTETFTNKTLTKPTLTAPLETEIPGGTCSTNYTIDPTTGTQFTLTLNGACQLKVTNLAATHSFVLYLTQSSTTAPTFDTPFKWASGTVPTFSTSATKYDTVACSSPDGTTLICNAIVDAR